jgi:hypothetical protein
LIEKKNQWTTSAPAAGEIITIDGVAWQVCSPEEQIAHQKKFDALYPLPGDYEKALAAEKETEL